MMYKVVYSKRAVKSLKKLDNYTANIIYSWIEKNLVDCKNPRLKGKVLKGSLRDYWSYRIGSYRLIAIIEDDLMIITALEISHRRDVYK